MISQKQLEEEVSARLQEARDQDEIVRATWLTHKIVKAWASPDGDDSDRWELCGYKHVRATVQRLVNREPEFSPGSQVQLDLVLDGWEHVRRRYPVERDNEQCIVPTMQLSEDETRSKAREYRVMGFGTLAHADELDRFADERWPAAAKTA